MQKLSGLLLVLAGTALGTYYYLPPAVDSEERLAEVTRISAAPDRARQTDRNFAPPVELTAIKPPAAAAQAGAARTAAATAAAGPQAGPADQAKPTAGGWTTVVTAESEPQGRLTSSKPGDRETRAQLARDLQRELKRVGCYSGEINGAWTPTTKRAMGAFMDRVNASLPMEEPDYILLTLVQGHAQAACGANCPSGQVISDGRCVPRAVVAQATRKSQRDEQRHLAASEQPKAAAVDRADAPAPAPRRLAAGNPAVQRQTLAASGKAEVLPWTGKPPAGATPAARPEPLPGIMTIGGPRDRVAAGEPVSAAPAVAEPAPGPRPAPARAAGTAQRAAVAAVETGENDNYDLAAPPPVAPEFAPRPPANSFSPPSGRAAYSPAPPERRAPPVYRQAPPSGVVYRAPKTKYSSSYAQNSGGGRHTIRSGGARYMQAWGGAF